MTMNNLDFINWKLGVLLLALAALLAPSSGWADLTISGTPGFVFSDTASGRPTVANLNRALNFTYAISGTIGGTNAGLAAKSVSGAMLMDSVVDNSTVEYNSSSPRAIRVKDAGIGVSQLSSAVAGPGLTGGSGVPLTNNVDGSTLMITNDVVTLGTNINPSFLAASNNFVLVGTASNKVVAVPLAQFATNFAGQITFTVTNQSLAAGSIYNAAHSLGVTPGFVRWVIVMGSTTELGYLEGDEVDLANASQTAANPMFGYGANTTNVWLVVDSVVAVNINNKSTGARALITASRWKAKCYIRP